MVVVDSRPLFEGRRMLTTLLAGGITCEYCHLNGLSYEITEVDKVGQCPCGGNNRMPLMTDACTMMKKSYI